MLAAVFSVQLAGSTADAQTGSDSPIIVADALPSLLPEINKSAQTNPIPLSAVFDETLMQSPRAASARAQLGIARSGYAQALTFPNPSFFYLNDTAQLSRQIGASVPIEPPWKVAFRLLLTKAQIKQADLELQRSLWQLRATTRRAYLDVVVARETIETLEDLHQLAADLVTTAERRFDAGDVAKLDVERAELAAIQAQADLSQGNRRLAQASQRLSVLMGRSHKTEVQAQRLPSFKLRVQTTEMLPDFTSPVPELDSLLAQAFQSRLDLKVTKQAMTVNDAALRNSIGNILPNPQLNAGHSFSGNPPDGPATRGYFLGVTQEVPVLNFQQGDIARLRATNRQLKREFESQKNLVTEEVSAAYQQLLAARERLKYFQDQILSKSENVAKMARFAYQAGQSDITTVLAAQQSNVQTKALYLEAVRAYQQALTDLEVSIGRPL